MKTESNSYFVRLKARSQTVTIFCGWTHLPVVKKTTVAVAKPRGIAAQSQALTFFFILLLEIAICKPTDQGTAALKSCTTHRHRVVRESKLSKLHRCRLLVFCSNLGFFYRVLLGFSNYACSLHWLSAWT